MTKTSPSHQTRRNFLANSAALGTVLGLGATLGLPSSASAFATSRKFVTKPHGCARKHADMSKSLRELIQGANTSQSASSHALKTSHCSDCGTMISADLMQAA